MQKFFKWLLRFVLKLVLAALGLVFAVSMLLAALVMLMFGLAKWAVTGKKPAPFAAFSQFRQFRKFGQFGQFGSGQFKPYSSASASRPAPESQIVDVVVREVKPAANDLSNDKSSP